MVHARQWASLGKDAYTKLGKFKREKHAFDVIMENKRLFNKAELKSASEYLRRLTDDYNDGLID